MNTNLNQSNSVKKQLKLVVLCGSPKGELSTTLQYVRLLEKRYPQHTFKIYPIAQQIKRIENNPALFEEIIQSVREADGVLWAFPLYFLLVHAHYKRFIELIFERGAQQAFKDKHAATLSTSIHFYDHTAHNYMHAICDDLGMTFVESISLDMGDLFKDKERSHFYQFGENFLDAIQMGVPGQRRFAPLQTRAFTYEPGPVPVLLDAKGKKVVIVSDGRDTDGNLNRMAARCKESFGEQAVMVNLQNIDIRASCQGCLQCGANYQCHFEGKDGFIDFYRSTIMTADILIYAGTISDRYLSSKWKTLFDRSFFNTHTPMLAGKQVVVLISGPLSQVANLQEILCGYFEFQMANLVGFVSDETGSSAEIDHVLDSTIMRTVRYAQQGFARPMTFLGLGGLKIFRDDIWSRLRFIFPADYRAFRKLGFYKTFPQRDMGAFLANTFLGPIFSIPALRKWFSGQIKEGMVRPMRQFVEKA